MEFSNNLRESTSASNSEYSMDRRKFTKMFTYKSELPKNKELKKKYANKDASSVLLNKKLKSTSEVVNLRNKPFSFTTSNTTNANTINSALARTRSYGYVVPPKSNKD
jgi:hypothetical protein